jgi:hypothetical protein
MMTQIKHALAFVSGALYASSVWAAVVLCQLPGDLALWSTIPFAVIIIGFIIIAVQVGGFLMDHWNEG